MISLSTRRSIRPYLQNAFFLPGLWLVIFITAVSITSMALLCGQSAAYAREVVLDPYADIDWDAVSQFKMNIHTHTTESDGRMEPAVVIDEYHARGYDALAITDHDRNTWPWTDFGRDPAALGMLAIPGNELSRHHHTLSLFSTYETEERDHDAALTGLADAGGLALLCHPAMHWLRTHHTAPSLRIPLTPALRSVARDDFTVEAWFRTTDAGRNILLGNYSGDYAGALNLELYTQNRVRLFLQPAGDGRTVDINVAASDLGIDTRDGQWHHLAGVRRGEILYLYLDGQPAGERPDRAGGFALQGDSFFIGRDTRTGDTAFNGALAQVRFWQRAFTPTEAASPGSARSKAANGLLAEYTFSQEPGADTAQHESGPFHGEVAGELSVASPDTTPEAMGHPADAVYAASFGPGTFPTTVPDAAVADYVALFRRHPHMVGTEVHNRTRPDREYPLDRDLWDRLLGALMPERPVWGAATDDMHSMPHLGGDWLVVPAQTLTTETARNALETGAYYFASTRLHEPDHANVDGTPRIEAIRHDPGHGTITVSATTAGRPVPGDGYLWVADGKSVHVGPMLPYQDVDGITNYVRLEITGSGGTTYTNPFGFRP